MYSAPIKKVDVYNTDDIKMQLVSFLNNHSSLKPKQKENSQEQIQIFLG